MSIVRAYSADAGSAYERVVPARVTRLCAYCGEWIDDSRKRGRTCSTNCSTYLWRTSRRARRLAQHDTAPPCVLCGGFARPGSTTCAKRLCNL